MENYQHLRTMNDVIDSGKDLVGRHIIFQINDNKLYVVERVINGRPDGTLINFVPFNETYLNSVSKETHTSINMLKAEYARYTTAGLYPDFLANIFVVKIESALGVLFGSAVSTGAKPIV